MQVLAQTSCRSWGQAQSEAGKLSSGRARLLILTILSQWPLLHWKSVPSTELAPWCPTNFMSHGLSRCPITGRHTLTICTEIFSLITQIVTRSCDPDFVWSKTGLWFPSSSSVRETESGAKFAASHKMLFFSEKSLYSEVDQSFNVDTENYLVSEQAFTGTAG